MTKPTTTKKDRLAKALKQNIKRRILSENQKKVRKAT